MKTAEEWLNEDRKFEHESIPTSLWNHLCTYESEHTKNQLLDFIKDVQLEAFKAGMTEAANIIKTYGVLNSVHESNRGKNAILTARDNKTTT